MRPKKWSEKAIEAWEKIALNERIFIVLMVAALALFSSCMANIRADDLKWRVQALEHYRNSQ